jgi:hypothetical protein
VRRTGLVALWLSVLVVALGAAPWAMPPSYGAEPDLLALPLDAALGQVPTLPVCTVPRTERELPERTNEMRLARDENGQYWQIQSGCRHRVVPSVMDSGTLQSIPLGEDIGHVTYGFPAPVPTPSPLAPPAYAQLPGGLLLPEPTPTPSPAPGDEPGLLRGYANRRLVVDPTRPEEVFLLDGRIRHRVLVFYPYCTVYPEALPLCQPLTDPTRLDLSRGGDPAVAPPFPYLLRRRADADCRDIVRTRIRPPVPQPCSALYLELFRAQFLARGVPEIEAELLAAALTDESAGFVANITEIPLGEPAPYYGWGRGESVVLTDRVELPEARPCRPTARTREEACSARFLNAQVITLEAYIKDPQRYAGVDVRLVGVACRVRYVRDRNVTTLILGSGEAVVPAVAPGRRAQQDPNMADNAQLEVAASVTPPGGSQQFATGELVIFEYTRRGSGTCIRDRS